MFPAVSVVQDNEVFVNDDAELFCFGGINGARRQQQRRAMQTCLFPDDDTFIRFEM